MTDIKKYNLFPIEIYHTNKVLDNDLMVTTLYNLKNLSKGEIDSSRGGWVSPKNIEKLKPFKELNLLIKSTIQNIFNNDCVIENMWGNISSLGHYGIIHNHPPMNISYTKNPYWSGVYYLKTYKNSGGFNIHSPINYSEAEKYSPVEGDLLIFNSTTYHSVDSNLEKEDRISIAFNLKFI